jgi:tetratricopeptide (TPR) repeat protein
VDILPCRLIYKIAILAKIIDQKSKLLISMARIIINYDNLCKLSISRNFIFIFLFLNVAVTITQAQLRKPKSFALVIGVSQYKDPLITGLNYAHLDAQAFADFCLSPSGLNIPPDQTKLLTNEDASYWNIVDGLDWLKTVAQKDDQIYFYFAGHGDMESKELKYGYLLAHDSRYMNYLGRSVSLDLLNKTAHTLSVTKKAKVFLITDACHSGKLAGIDFNGNNLVAMNLMQLVSKNEVRITSCNEGELSYEDEIWGNGRGAFSYFLTKGMAGEADGVNGKKDGDITIGEIKAFLSGKVPNDVRTVKRAKQNPVVMGTETILLNQFKPMTSNMISDNMTINASNAPTSDGSRGVAISTDNESFTNDLVSAVTIQIKSEKTDFEQLALKNNKGIREYLLEKLFNQLKYTKRQLSSSSTDQLIAKTLYENVQNIIDLYLSGDEAELEKRRYYSQVAKPYDQYPHMINIAIKLLPKDHYLIPSLEMQKEYLSGLALRLKIPLTKDYLPLIEKAQIHQEKALAIEPNAAFIHNELGIIYLFKKDYEKAKFHFEKANIIAPLWALPYANLANLHYVTKDYTTAKEFVNLTIEKQSNLQSPYIIDGNLYLQSDNLLFAEEMYQKAIKLNSRHYLPFEKLGETFLKVQNFEASNHYYYESESRKSGLVNMIDIDSDGVIDGLFTNVQSPRIVPSFDSTNVIGSFSNGKHFFGFGDYETAEHWFQKVVKMDVENPLVYFYLGQIAYYNQTYNKAEYYFKLAFEFHKEDSIFIQHVDTVLSNLFEPITRPSFQDIYIYKESNFEIYSATIYLARNYEKWGNYTSATELYTTCITIDPQNKSAYYMLWNLYKNNNALELAENTINRLGNLFPELLDRALADFYEWVLDNYNEDLQKTEHYAYKYGLLIHQFMMNHPGEIFGESLKSNPDEEYKDFPLEQNNIDMILMPEDNKIMNEVEWVDPPYINYPLSTGVKMFKKVVAISVDKHIRADAFAKMGDIYYRAESLSKALENYEQSLNLKDDDIGIRSKAINCANQLFFFQKALNHLTTLKEENSLNFDDAILLAQYYMKMGDKENAVSLSTDIANTHPILEKKVEMDRIITHLRFKEYEKSIELINLYIQKNGEGYITEFMLARAHAGINKPNEALKYLENAVSLGFNFGFVYKNDSIFDKYRTTNEWNNISKIMENAIEEQMNSK